MRIGVVCEGLHDFLALKAIFGSLARKKGVVITAFDSVQPRVDATSSVQVSGGGWHRVKVWLEDNRGADLRKILASNLFSASTPYDILLIHMDGDVIWLAKEFSSNTRASCFGNPGLIVATMEKFIEATLQPPDEMDDYIIYAVPVLHTECWLVAASSERPFRRNIENLKIKKVGQRFLQRKFGSEINAAANKAANLLDENLDTLRTKYQSLDHFAVRVESAFL